MLIVVNGDDTGGHHVTSADVSVNGVVVGPETLGGDRHVVRVPVTLAASNTVRAILRGPRSTWLTIAIRPSLPVAK